MLAMAGVPVGAGAGDSVTNVHLVILLTAVCSSFELYALHAFILKLSHIYTSKFSLISALGKFLAKNKIKKTCAVQV